MPLGFRFLNLVWALLFCLSVSAYDACPRLETISRISGEYAWQSTDGRWEGYFASPRIGRGDSNQVIGFREARWIQLTDLKHSYGVVECDYQGNSQDEIIRFVSTATMTTQKPKNQNWSCEYNAQFPGTQCLCAADPGQCQL